MRGFILFLLGATLFLSVPFKIYVLLDGALSLKFGWLFFRFAPQKWFLKLSERKKARGEKKPKPKKVKKPKKPQAKEKKTITLSEIIHYADIGLSIMGKASEPMLRMMKRTHIKNLELYALVGGEDAHDCAIRFGHTNTIVYNLLAAVALFTRLDIKKVDISPAFGDEDDSYFLRATIRIVPLLCFGLGLNLLYIALREYVKKSNERNLSAKEDKKHGKSNAKSKTQSSTQPS